MGLYTANPLFQRVTKQNFLYFKYIRLRKECLVELDRRLYIRLMIATLHEMSHMENKHSPMDMFGTPFVLFYLHI